MMNSAEVNNSPDDDFRLRKDWKKVTSVFRKGGGEITKLLSEGEFELFKNVPIFESSFIQVDTFGNPKNLFGDPMCVTIGITASHMLHFIPDLMLIAKRNQQSTADSPNGSLELQSLYLLSLVKISVLDVENRRIKMTMANGQELYLQLYTPDDSGDELFKTWRKLISLLSLQWEKRPVYDDFRLQKHWKKVTSVFRKGGGELRKLLSEGEFELFKNVPIFESSFIQVNSYGEKKNISKHPIFFTIGITASQLLHWIPNIMLIAKRNQQSTGDSPHGPFQLRSLYPLSLVKISVSDVENRTIKLTMANGQEFYMQLYTPDDSGDELFKTWRKLISLLSLQWEKRPVSANPKPILVEKATQTDLQNTSYATEMRIKREQEQLSNLNSFWKMIEDFL